MWNRRAQSTAEYAIVLGVVVAALVAMQVYVKRGLNARLKDASDSSTDSVAATLASIPGVTVRGTALERKQYEPDYASSTFHTTRDSQETQKMVHGGKAGRFTKESVREHTERRINDSQTTAAAPQ